MMGKFRDAVRKVKYPDRSSHNSVTFSSPDFWNIDGYLVNPEVRKVHGSQRWLNIESSERIGGLCFALSTVVALLPLSRRVVVHNVALDLYTQFMEWEECREVVDLAWDVRQKLYLLEISTNSIVEVDTGSGFVMGPTSLSKLSRYELRGLQVDERSRLVLGRRRGSDRPVGVVSSGASSRLLIRELLAEGGEETIEPVGQSLSSLSGGWVSGMDFDDERNSIVVASSSAGQVIEVQLDDGTASVLAGGLGRNGGGDGGPASTASFVEPEDIVSFPYCRYLDVQMLCAAHKRRLERASGKLPSIDPRLRCILVADPGAHRVRKIVELEAGRSVIGLVGSGKPEVAVVPQANLLDVSIPAPARIAMSAGGALAIASKSDARILLLTPGSVPFNVITSVNPEDS